jgi:type II secretory pathway component GspD/PulD (secretin)
MGTETIIKVFYLKNATVSTSSLKSEMARNVNSSSTSGSSSSSTSGSTTPASGSKWKEDSESGITSVIKKLLSGADLSNASGANTMGSSTTGSSTSGVIGSVIEDFRTNSLIVTDTPAKMKVISQVIASLDVAVPEVMLEVEMLDVSKDVVDKMGFKFGDTPFTAIVTGATAGMGFPYAGWTKLLHTNDGSLSINPTGSTYQMQLDFMRTQTDTKFLARPKLLTLNNETAEISITKDEIVGREDTVNDTSSGTTTTSVFKRSTDLALTKEGTGVFLRVTPQINLDTNEITMVVNPKTSVTSISALSTTNNQQADVEVRSTKSIVKIGDGETVVLGGLIHQDKTVAFKKLPILGDIPLLGMFFRHKNQTKGLEREIIVFITPHIVRDKTDIKLAQVLNIQLPIREQGSSFGTTRDYIINSNMNKFEKKH